MEPYYAVKCNSDPTILQWLSSLGTSFDCASAREMNACRMVVGSSKDNYKIIFANPCKTSGDIDTARNMNVPWTTIDCCEELNKMRDRTYMPELMFRLAVDDSASDTPFSKKFGLQNWDEVKRLYNFAVDRGFRVRGFSFHVGSGCHDVSQYVRAIDKVDSFWGKLLGLGAKDLRTIDIGGGFLANEYKFASAAAAIKKGVAKLNFAKGANIIAEPGRFFAAPSHDLFVQVIGKKPGLGNGTSWRYTIDESVYGQFSCIPFDGQKPPFARISLDKKKVERRKTPAVMFGRTCDSLDVICYGSEMEELEIGDWLYFPWMGAYTTVTSSEFNGFPKPLGIYEYDNKTPNIAEWPNTIYEDLSWQKGIEYALETRSRI